MTEVSWGRVGRALLGRWPSQVAQWGEEGISAFVEELQAAGMGPEHALAAIRTYRPVDGKDFPPSVAALSKLAQADPSRPTFDEMLTLVTTALRAYNRPLRGDFSTEAQMLGAREAQVLERAQSMHPLVVAFIVRHGVSRLQDEVGELSGEYGGIRRGELERAWGEHVQAFGDREVAALVSGRRGAGLVAFDPLVALGAAPLRRQIGSGSGQ